MTYSNLPITNNQTTFMKLMNSYTSNSSVTINASVWDAVVGFFESRGFSETSSKSMAQITITQAISDNMNPMQLIDKFKSLSSNQLSTLIIDIVNFNRYKTSNIGTASTFSPSEAVSRQIIL